MHDEDQRLKNQPEIFLFLIMYHVHNIDNNEMIMEKDEKIKKLGKMFVY